MFWMEISPEYIIFFVVEWNKIKGIVINDFDALAFSWSLSITTPFWSTVKPSEAIDMWQNVKSENIMDISVRHNLAQTKGPTTF